MTNSAPVPPQGPPIAPTGPKKTSPFVWILGGCFAILVIGGIITAGALWWGYHKAKNFVNQEIDSRLGKMQTVSELWSDVPGMDGMTPTQNDMPAPVKLLFGTILGNLGRLNKEGEPRDTGTIDWMVFSSTHPPDDIKTYYTPERMTPEGWDRTDKSTCVSGSEQGFPQVGAFCVFQRGPEDLKTQLAIIAWQESGSKESNIFFLRLIPDKKQGS